MSAASALSVSFLAQDRADATKIASTVLVSAAALCLALRIYTKVMLVKRVCASDAAMCLAVVCYTWLPTVKKMATSMLCGIY